MIHDFFVPAFRIKHDVLPGRYETLWFTADQTGHLSSVLRAVLRHRPRQMIGQVVVMPGRISSAGWQRTAPSETLVARASTLFIQLRLQRLPSAARSIAPCARRSLDGLYGSPVPLSDGSTVIADDRYIRDSILHTAQRRSSPAMSRSCRPSPA